jgi:enamine deaminase RidA (YjgF/YER057c/UK114 family)
LSAFYFDPPGAGPKKGLYSHVGATRAGTFLHIAGQLSFDHAGAFIGENDFDAQFRQVMSNLGDVLKGCGASFNDVLKFTTYLTSDRYIEPFMHSRAALFPTLFSSAQYPPNTLLVISRLVHPGCMLEIEAVAQCTDPAMAARIGQGK